MHHDLFIIAGEASGDQLGEGLLQALHEINPHLKIAGVGGPKMRNVGMDTVFPMEKLQVMGFIDVFLSLPRLFKLFKKTLRAILSTNPKVVVTIDYPGFNLRLAKALRKRGFKGKICHYICPSVWAWGKNRIHLMAENLDLLLSVLPFEKQYFASTKLPVEYIGHPLVQKISLQAQANPHLIAFFPGSRSHEIERNLPFYLRLIQTLQVQFPSHQYVISLSQEKHRPLLEKMTSLPLITQERLQNLQPFLAIAKSGTITLELALRGIPTVVTYAISRLDYFLARYLFRISLPFYALPNLICNRPIFPEFIGPTLTDENLLSAVKKFITNSEAWTQCQRNCYQIRTLLASKNPSHRAAELILTLF